jgi:hypothetical protein
MSERHDIVLREASGAEPNPPGLISELRDLVREVFPETVEDMAQSGAGWLRGKSQQEIAKAMEIRATAMEKLGKLEIERLKLIKERDEVLQKSVTEQKRDDLAHKQKMFELKTERLKAVVEALKVIKEMDIKLTVQTTRRIQAALADVADPSAP